MHERYATLSLNSKGAVDSKFRSAFAFYIIRQF